MKLENLSRALLSFFLLALCCAAARAQATVIKAGRLIDPFGGQYHLQPERRNLGQPEYLFADTRDELRKAVRENAHFGARVIKIVVDDQPYVCSVDDIRFIIAEAKEAGLKVAAHCLTERGPRRRPRINFGMVSWPPRHARPYILRRGSSHNSRGREAGGHVKGWQEGGRHLTGRASPTRSAARAASRSSRTCSRCGASLRSAASRPSSSWTPASSTT